MVLTMEGMIYLYDKDEVLIKALSYHCPAARKKILANWERQVGYLFKRMAIHICPAANEKLVKFNGQNAMRISKLTMDEIKEPIVRPKAEYTNLPTYQYK